MSNKIVINARVIRDAIDKNITKQDRYEFNQLIHRDFERFINVFGNMLMFDLMKFEHYMKMDTSYVDISLQNFLTKKYGPEFSQFIKSLCGKPIAFLE